MAIAEICIVPLGTQTPSVGKYVAEIHKRLNMEANGRVKFQLNPMSTVLEGDLDELFSLIRKLHEVPFEHGALRVSTSIRIDDRRDKKSSMEQKVRSVQEKLR